MSGPQSTPKTKLVCWVCKEPITGAKTVIDGFWHCGDCTYKHDYPDRVQPDAPKQKRAKKQDEKLFEVPQRHRDAA